MKKIFLSLTFLFSMGLIFMQTVSAAQALYRYFMYVDGTIGRAPANYTDEQIAQMIEDAAGPMYDYGVPIP